MNATTTSKIISPRRFSIFILMLTVVIAGVYATKMNDSTFFIGIGLWLGLLAVTYLSLTKLELVVLIISAFVWLFGMQFLKSFPSNPLVQIPLALVSFFALILSGGTVSEARKREGSRLTITLVIFYLLLFALGLAIRTFFNLK